MQRTTHQTYCFDEFKLDLTRGCVYRGVVELKLRPQSFDVLKYLTQNQGRLVSKDELIASVWNGMAVTDDSLVQCMKDIRRALGDDAQQIIKTVPRRGYIFEKDVKANGAIYSEETSAIRLVIEETEDTNGHADGIKVPRSTSSRAVVAGALRRNKLITGIAVASTLLAGGAIGYALLSFLGRPPSAPFRSVTIQRLTNDGKAVGAAISPDGKYFAYITKEEGKESLWVRQVTSVSSVQIAGPAEVGYSGLVFSRDSNFLYYSQGGHLYQTGTLGGSTRKVLDNVGSRITLSPDGKRLAFVRPGQGDGLGSRLVLVNADGTGDEQILAFRKPPDSFTVNGCSWSPDGQTIVCPGGDNPLFGQQFPLAVQVADGSQVPLTKKRWNLVRPSSWLADGSGFVMTAWDSFDSGAQLWHVTYPGGVATRIYSDLSDYRAASLTADGSTLLAVQRQPQLNIHVISFVGERTSRQLTFGTSGRTGFEGITSTPDGSIIYSSEDGTTRDLWIMNADGTSQRRLTFDEPMESNASISSDGRSMVYGVASQGIWRADLDGGNRRQLTPYGMFPVYSADGNWVFYTLPRDGWKMWKVPAGGGEPMRVTDHPGVQPDVSPDGKLIAYMNMTAGEKAKLYIVPVEGGQPVAIFDALPLGQFDIHWLRDGRGVAYKAIESSIQKIVSQPLDGGPPQTLFATESESEGIAGWGFSHDGKQLYYSAGPMNQNVVMFALER